MDFKAIYDERIKALNYQEDPEQLKIISEMQRISDALPKGAPTAPAAKPSKGFFKKFLGGDKETTPHSAWIPGLYVWGGVGRGKTFLMDLFFNSLETERKERRHFHRFMLEFNDSLQALHNVQYPVDHVVQQLKKSIDILCLDEFFVSDITHAMLLDRILRAMQKYGITIVTTSNIIPDDLYKNGLQRERFLPAIAWIKENLVVHHLLDGEDFRKRHFTTDDIFRIPDNATTREEVIEDLLELTGYEVSSVQTDKFFTYGSRKIPLVWEGKKALVFTFKELCEGYYSQKDYIEIAKQAEYVGLLGVPVMNETLESAARRFLLMIDEFYDRRVKLLLTLAAPVKEIYQGETIAFEFDRLQSRLFEMQSPDYWKEAYLA